MLYRPYGTTGLEVSAIGFGGMRMPADFDKAAALVQAAYEAGVNYFDTAIHYPNSEEIFGAAFKEMKKSRAQRPFYVATKTFGADESSVRKDLEVSLKRLGLERIDFYHIWCVLSPQAWQE
ncbi:MAG: aldo/keto reductase, partial [Planctomycetota bacterium]|nr:aldo/keto reductase [Planctomycetota bacterium]